MYEENEVLHALCTRRSVRKYDTARQVELKRFRQF